MAKLIGSPRIFTVLLVLHLFSIVNAFNSRWGSTSVGGGSSWGSGGSGPSWSNSNTGPSWRNSGASSSWSKPNTGSSWGSSGSGSSWNSGIGSGSISIDTDDFFKNTGSSSGNPFRNIETPSRNVHSNIDLNTDDVFKNLGSSATDLHKNIGVSTNNVFNNKELQNKLTKMGEKTFENLNKNNPNFNNHNNIFGNTGIAGGIIQQLKTTTEPIPEEMKNFYKGLSNNIRSWTLKNMSGKKK